MVINNMPLEAIVDLQYSMLKSIGSHTRNNMFASGGLTMIHIRIGRTMNSHTQTIRVATIEIMIYHRIVNA